MQQEYAEDAQDVQDARLGSEDRERTRVKGAHTLVHIHRRSLLSPLTILSLLFLSHVNMQSLLRSLCLPVYPCVSLRRQERMTAAVKENGRRPLCYRTCMHMHTHPPPLSPCLSLSPCLFAFYSVQAWSLVLSPHSSLTPSLCHLTHSHTLSHTHFTIFPATHALTYQLGCWCVCCHDCCCYSRRLPALSRQQHQQQQQQ